MITVKLRPDTMRQGSGSSDTSSYQVPGVISWHLNTYARVWRPPTDVYENENELIIRVELAGMQEEDFSIQVNQNILNIHGSRTENTGRKSYHQMEINFGDFNIELELPTPVEIEKAHAEYQSGFLVVIFPIARPTRILVDKA